MTYPSLCGIKLRPSVTVGEIIEYDGLVTIDQRAEKSALSHEDKQMTITICGIPYTVTECEDHFNADGKHFGQVDFLRAEISINKNMAAAVKEESLVHEIVHAVLVHIGRPDLSEDETFVQSFANAINQSFLIKGKGDAANG